MTKETKKLWSADINTKWHAPEGFFEQNPEKIAEGLHRDSDSKAQAMDRLNFYINRAGKNLTAEEKARLEKAKSILEKLDDTETQH